MAKRSGGGQERGGRDEGDVLHPKGSTGKAALSLVSNSSTCGVALDIAHGVCLVYIQSHLCSSADLCSPMYVSAAVCSRRSFQVSCSPLSPFERRLAATPSGLTATEGWFKVCVSGGANSRQLAGAAAAAAAGAATSSALALVPASSEPGTPSAAAGTAGVGCSEYCAKLSEAMYTLCDHALTLLVATAPAVDPDEVASGQGLGPMWPSVRALAAVLVSPDAVSMQQPALKAGRFSTVQAASNAAFQVTLRARLSNLQVHALACCDVQCGYQFQYMQMYASQSLRPAMF